jgi:hypothetical protein
VRIARMLVDAMRAEMNQWPMSEVARAYKMTEGNVRKHKRRFYAAMKNGAKVMRLKVRAANQREDEEVEGAWD